MSFGVVVVPLVRADEPSPAADAEVADEAEEKIDEELLFEIAYVEALVDNGYPDFAEPVIAATKKKWPESDAMFFAIEVRGLLSLGKFDEAEKIIAALPDRKGSKYWAARLEVANYYFGRNQKESCIKIYDEFFAMFPKPPKGLEKFYVDAGYAYGQILSQAKNFDKASEVYAKILPNLRGSSWLSLATEYCDLLMRVAENCTDKEKDKRDKALGNVAAMVERIIEQSLKNESAVLFGRAIGMKAHLEQLKGNVKRANLIIEEFQEDLENIDDQIRETDPEGRLGLLKISPLPEVMYLQAKMLWEEAQKEFSKPKHDDELVKSYMFGERDDHGKRDGKGAFNLSVSVFNRFEMSPWAPLAGELSEEVRKFAEEKYGAKIKTKVTAEDMARVRAAQFKSARDKYNSQEYLAAIADYMEVLSKYPEIPESVGAIHNVIYSYLGAMDEEPNAEIKAEYRDNADAIEGYLAERFSGSSDNVVMSMAGDAVLACAAKEMERGELERADRLFTLFVNNFQRHVKAPSIAAAKGGELFKAGKIEDSMRYWGYLEKYYTNSTYYATALLQMAKCHEALGNREETKRYYRAYLPVEASPANRGVANMQLAQMYQKDAMDLLAGSETNEIAEAQSLDFKNGMIQIINAIKQFADLANQADKALANPRVSESERKTLLELREGSLFLAGQCRGRLGQCLKKIGRVEMGEKQMNEAASAYETYLSLFPKGKYSKAAYVQQGTIYTALGQVDKSKDAFDRLSRAFPDSEEAKNAKPHLAKALLEMDMKKEGTEIYAEMLRTDGAYSAQQFVNAGEALIDAKSWDLANQAFEKAVAVAGTNQMSTVARARIGQAKSLFRQKSFAEARAQLDMFLSDQKMSRLAIAADANLLLAEIASEQGRTEKEDDLRRKHFNAAVGAIRKLRNYRKGKPQEEVDEVDLMSADIVIKRMKAEDALAQTASSEEERQRLEAIAKDTCATAAQMLQTFLQTRAPDEGHPLSSMSKGALANLDRCYSTMIPLFSRLGDEQADRVMEYGAQYLEYFPDGKGRTEVINCMNRAKNSVAAPSAGAEPAAAPSAAPAPVQEDAGEVPAEEENANVNEESEGETENE